jgi:hypothetical protein
LLDGVFQRFQCVKAFPQLGAATVFTGDGLGVIGAVASPREAARGSRPPQERKMRKINFHVGSALFPAKPGRAKTGAGVA